MAQRSENWFRRTGRVTLTRDDGSQAEGFGLVIPWGCLLYTSPSPRD